MLVLIDGVETPVYAVLDEYGSHMQTDDGFLYETEGGLRISILHVAEPTAPPPTIPAVVIPAVVEDDSRFTPSPLRQPTPPVLSCRDSPPPSGDGERESWSDSKSRYLISKYKEAKDSIGKRGGFRTKKAMWEKLARQINDEFGSHLTPLQVENKWKTMERAYKKSKVKNGSSGHSRSTCLYERELSEVLEKEHHITPVALLAPGRIVAEEENMLPDNGPADAEEEEPPTPSRSTEATPARRRSRQDRTAIGSLIKVLQEAMAEKKQQHQEKMRLLERLVRAAEANKE